MGNWRVTETQRREPLEYEKEYPRKGTGVIRKFKGGRCFWFAYIMDEEKGDPKPMDGGFAGSLEEGKKAVDTYFELVDEYD